MNPVETNWTPALVVLALGAIGGLIYLYLNWSKLKGGAAKVAPAPGDARAIELDTQARMLIDQLHELETNQHQFSAEQYAAEKVRLEQAAANALRAKDEYLKGRKVKGGGAVAAAPAVTAPAAAPAPVGTGLFARHPELKGAAWGAGIVAFFGLMGVLLFQNETAREGDGPMTGGSAAARAGQMEQGEAEAYEQEVQAAIARAEQNPQDTNLNALVVHELIRRQDWERASTLTERTLGADPFHVENRVHRAVLKAPKGDVKGAITELQELVNKYPEAHEALLFIGTLSMQERDAHTALEAFERFAKEAPAEEQPPQLAQAIESLRQAHPPHP